MVVHFLINRTGMCHGVPMHEDRSWVRFSSIVLYTADLQAVVEWHGLSPHFYADESQICGLYRPGDVGTLSQRLLNCVNDVAVRIRSNHCSLTSTKPISIGAPLLDRRLSQFLAGPLTFGGYTRSCHSNQCGTSSLTPTSVDCARTSTSSSSAAHANKLRSVRRYVSVPVCQSLVMSLVLTRLDFCSSVVFELPAGHLHRLQAVQIECRGQPLFSLLGTEHISDDALMCLFVCLFIV
jgi:hypothetical protein